MSRAILDKNDYLDICYLVNHLKEMGAFQLFDTENCFYFKDEKDEGVIIFVDNFGNECYGLSLFCGRDGLNTYHDLITLNDQNSFDLNEYNSINLMMCKKSGLVHDEIKMLNDFGVKLHRKDNIIPRTLKRGYFSAIVSKREARLLIDFLQYLLVLIKNDYEKISDGFINEKHCCSFFSKKNRKYSVELLDLPYLEREYEYAEANTEYASELMGFKRVDQKARVFIKNVDLPVRLKKNSQVIYPLSVILEYENIGVVEYDNLVATPKEYTSLLLSIIHSGCEKNGIPYELVINDRRVYSEIKKTMELVGINLHLQIENEEINEMVLALNYGIVSFCNTIIRKKGNFISEEAFRKFNSTIRQVQFDGVAEDISELEAQLFTDSMSEDADDTADEEEVNEEQYDDLVS